MKTALILAAHGSNRNPDTAGIVWDYVDQLRARDVADVVTATFWMEAPEYHEVRRTIQTDVVMIVPLFSSAGYFSKTIIPRAMQLDGDFRQRGAQQIHLTKTLGQHPDLHAVVEKRVQDVLEQNQLNPDEVSVAIIGHGTPRNNRGLDTIQTQANTLRDKQIVSAVHHIYLEDEPYIPSIYETITTPHLIAVPYFLAYGMHVSEDVPEALGIDTSLDVNQVGDVSVYYAPPIGTADVVLDLILDLAKSTAVNIEKYASTSNGIPQVGMQSFANYIRRNNMIEFGQLRITENTIRHIEADNEPIQLTSLSRLRDHVRKDPFRPLPTSTDLPTDWEFQNENVSSICAAVETIYPTAIANWFLHRQGWLEIESMERLAERYPSGHERWGNLTSDQQDSTIERVCGNCVKSPLWAGSELESKSLPCASACHWLLSE